MSTLKASDALAQTAQDAAPGSRRVTLDHIKAQVKACYFMRLADGLETGGHKLESPDVIGVVWETGERAPLELTTLCVLVLKNGYTIIGKSACADPKLYNQAVGEKVALDDALAQIWPLEGYVLRNELAKAG